MSPGQDPGQNSQCHQQQIIVGQTGLSAVRLVCRVARLYSTIRTWCDDSVFDGHVILTSRK